MAAYRQEFRKLEEIFNGIELHHILRRDNKVIDALAQLRSSHEPHPSGVFTHDLFNPSIQLEEDILIPTPRISLGEDIPVPVLGTPPGKDSPTSTSEINSRASVGPIKQNREPRGEIAVVVRAAQL
jgi:hypothetical protein